MSTTTSPASSSPSWSGSETIDYTKDVTPLDYCLIGSTLLTVAFIGVVFNGIAISVFIRYRDLRSPTNSFILALCVCDFLMSAIGAPIPAYFSFRQTYITSSLLCSIDAFCVYFLSCASIYLLAAISVDRYLIIVKPVPSLVVTQRAANLAITVCFLLGFLWAVMPLVGWNEYSLEGIGVACSVTWDGSSLSYNIFIIMMFVGCFLVPLVIMAFCYISIFVTVRKIFRGAFVRTLRKHYMIESRMLKTIIVMIVLFLISWTPYSIVSFSVAFGSPIPMSRIVETIPALIAKSCCIWNPIVYVAMNAHFRAGFCSIVPFLKHLSVQTPDNELSKENYATRINGTGRTAEQTNGISGKSTDNNLERQSDRSRIGSLSITMALAPSSIMKQSPSISFISQDTDNPLPTVHGDRKAINKGSTSLILNSYHPGGCSNTEEDDEEDGYINSSGVCSTPSGKDEQSQAMFSAYTSSNGSQKRKKSSCNMSASKLISEINGEDGDPVTREPPPSMDPFLRATVSDGGRKRLIPRSEPEYHLTRQVFTQPFHSQHEDNVGVSNTSTEHTNNADLDDTVTDAHSSLCLTGSHSDTLLNDLGTFKKNSEPECVRFLE